MPRTNQIFQTEALYIGPAPASGYCFISGAGLLNNNFQESYYNNNLLKAINRIQSATYSFNIDYAEINQLGKRGSVYKPIINHPSVVLNFDYIQHSVINELRLGFNANYYNTANNEIYYANNFLVSLISGLVDRKLEQPTVAPYWPLSTRDKRNIFIVAGTKGIDVNLNSYALAHPRSQLLDVFAFGDCYLTSYTTRGAINSYPTTSVSFICENMEVYSSGSGVNIPSLNNQTREYVNSNKFIIPTNYDGTGFAAALLPGDINLSFESLPKLTGILALYGTGYSGAAYSDIINLGAKFSDIKAQSYEIGINLGRNALHGLGYKIPVDRPIIFPVYCTLNTSFIVGDNQTGSLRQLLSDNSDYNVKVTLDNPTYLGGERAIQYDILRAKLISYNCSASIGPSKLINLTFLSELDPDDTTKGLFISGRAYLDLSGNYLLKQNDGTKFLLSNTDTSYILSQRATTIMF